MANAPLVSRCTMPRSARKEGACSVKAALSSLSKLNTEGGTKWGKRREGKSIEENKEKGIMMGLYFVRKWKTGRNQTEGKK